MSEKVKKQAKIVAKFGGSNLKDRDDILKIVGAVKAYDRPMVVVVSAFYGITNYLAEALSAAGGGHNDGEQGIQRVCETLIEKKRQVIENNIKHPEIRADVLHTVKKRVEQLKRQLLGVHYISEVPASVYARVMSFGERLSAPVVRAIFCDNGLDSEEKLPEDMGFNTDGDFYNATVDFEASSPAVAQALSADKVWVVPGFYGMSGDGMVNLLGRGGSDYSASAISRCIGAESLDIWKDVDGFMSADPRLVANPRPLEHLSYREAAELSYFGARILHPRTVEPLREPGIPVRIFNIDRYSEGIVPVSRIEKEHRPLTGLAGESISHRVKSVTYSEDFGLLRLSGSGIGSRAGVLGAASAEFGSAGINIKSVVTTQTSINFFLSGADLAEARRIAVSKARPTVSKIEAFDQYAIVALVGEGLEECEEIAETLILALSRNGLHAKMISIGASETATYFIINKKDIFTSIRAVHDAFFPAES